jgi:hypothetical protein
MSEQPTLPPGWLLVVDPKSKQEYYWHKPSKQTSWIPPPPPPLPRIEENESSRATGVTTNRSENISTFFPRVPEAILHDDQDMILFNPTFMGESSDDEEEEESPPPKLTAVQLTWVVDSKTLLKSANGIKGVEERCQELGLSLTEADGKKKMKAQLSIEVREYFVELHEMEGSSYLQSDIFAAKKQSIDRRRVATTNARRKATFDSLASTLSPKQKSKHRFKKKTLTVKQVMRQFPDSGFYVGGGGQIRCECGNKALGSNCEWDDNAYKRHIGGKKHKKYVAGKNSIQVRLAARANEVIAVPNNRIDLQGTRASSVCLADILYRKRITRMIVGAGIVLNKVALLEDLRRRRRNHWSRQQCLRLILFLVF